MLAFVRPAIPPATCLALALLALSALGHGSAAQAQIVTLHLSQESIAEDGGSATVTATVSPTSPTPFAVEVSAQAIVETLPELDRIELSTNRTLTFAGNAASSTGTVTITAIDNDGHTDQVRGGVTVEVDGTVSGGTSVIGPQTVELAIVEDDGIGTPDDPNRPELVKTSDGFGGTVNESRMVLTFNEPLNTNKLDEHSFRYRVNGGRYLSPDSAVVSGSTVIVTLQAPVKKGDTVWTRYKPPLVGTRSPVFIGSGDIFLGLAVQDPAGNPLYSINSIKLRNDTKPRVRLTLTPATIDENGGRTTVTATVPEAQATPFTVTVSVAPTEGVELSANAVLSFAANATTSTGDVTIAALDNDVLAANPEVTVSGTVSGTSDLLAPFDVLLAIRDDEAPPPPIAVPDAPAQAWLSRFGRVVAGHAVDALDRRLAGTAGHDSQVTLAGQQLPLGPGSGHGQTLHSLANTGGPDEWGDAAGEFRGLSVHDLLRGSSFLLSLGADGDEIEGAGTRWTAWGRGDSSRFDGAAERLALEGDVTTVTLGGDAAWERWLAGAAISLSEGTGGFRSRGDANEPDGRAAAVMGGTLTSVHPYLRYRANDRLSLWGMLGYGSGDLALEDDATGRWRTDIAMRMAAAGALGSLLPASEEGDLELTLRTDAMLVQMRSVATTGEAGNLAPAEADVGRLRVILEGAQSVALGDGRMLTPSLEAGLRHDGGDAETGMGIVVGGGLHYSDPAAGVTLDANLHGLVAHEDADYAEWGANGSVRIDPGDPGRGLSLTLAPAWGAASGGTERLWSIDAARGLVTGDGNESSARFDAQVGYGFAAFAGSGTATSYAGLSLSGSGEHTLRSGVRWAAGPALSFGLEGIRRAPADDAAVDHGIGVSASLRW